VTAVIITGSDVFADSDPSHPVASVKRVGTADGPKFRVLLPGEDIGLMGERTRHDFDEYDEAVAWASDIAALVEADPRLASPAAYHRAAELSVAQARIEELEAALAAAKETDAQHQAG
jgi:hypothetical protein